MPEFFGFEGVGILFRDHATSNLFSIEQEENEEDTAVVKRKLKDPHSKKKQELSHEEAIDDVAR